MADMAGHVMVFALHRVTQMRVILVRGAVAVGMSAVIGVSGVVAMIMRCVIGV